MAANVSRMGSFIKNMRDKLKNWIDRVKSQRYGSADEEGSKKWYAAPLLLFILWIGVYPQPFLRRMDASVNAFVTRFEAKKQAALAGSPAGETMLVRYFDGQK